MIDFVLLGFRVFGFRVFGFRVLGFRLLVPFLFLLRCMFVSNRK